MAHIISFDTHEYVKKIKKAGFTEEQADIQAQALSGALESFQDNYLSNLATKHDIRELELRLKNELTLRLGGMLVVGITVVATLVKIL